MANRVSGITVEIDGDTIGLSKALQGVNKDIRTTQAQLKDVNRLMKLDPGNTELMAQKHKLLQDAIGHTKTKLDQLKDAQKQANQALADGKISQDQYDGLQREIEETVLKLKDLEKQAKQSDIAVQKMVAAGNKLKDVGSGMTSVGKNLSMAITAPLAAAGAKGVQTYAEVDKTMALANKTMGNTADEADELNTAMKKAAAASKYGMEDAANAALNFARAGLKAGEAADTLAPAMNLAAGEGGDLDTVSAGLVATIKSFHGEFGEAADYADVFAAACNNSALDVNGLSQAMSVAAPVFSSAGYNVKDAALYLGIMANAGIDAEKGATSLKTGLARLVAPAKQGAEAMAALGFSVTNADGSMKDSLTVHRELHEAFSKLSESEQLAAASAIFGKNQMAPWLALINTAPESVNGLNTSLVNCKDLTTEMADTMMTGFGGSIEKLKSSIDVLLYSIGQALAPVLLQIVQHIQSLVDKFNELSPAQQEIIVKIGLAAAALGPLLILTGKLMSSVGTILTAAPKIVKAFYDISGAVSKIGTGITKFLPLIKKVSGVGALLGGATLAVKSFVDMFQNGASVVKELLMGLGVAIAAVGAILLGAPAAVAAIVAGIVFTVANLVLLIKQHWKDITTFFKNGWAEFTKGCEDFGKSVSEGLTAKLDAIGKGFSDVWTTVKTSTGEAFDAVSSKVGGAMDSVKNYIKNGLTEAKNNVSLTLNGIRQAFTQTWDKAKEIVKGAIDKIKGFMKFKWSLPKLKLPHFSITGGFSLDPPDVPHLSVEWYKKAMGEGMILKGATIFGAGGGKLLGGGEAGPEAVVGVSSLRSMIQEAVAGQTSAIAQAISGIEFPAQAGDIVIPVYVGGTLLDEMVVNAQNRQNLRSGGR